MLNLGYIAIENMFVEKYYTPFRHHGITNSMTYFLIEDPQYNRLSKY